MDSRKLSNVLLDILDFQILLLLFILFIRIQQPIPKLRTRSFLPIKLFATTIAMKNIVKLVGIGQKF